MGDIDKVSQSLGRIEANISILLDRAKTVDEKLTIQNGSIKKAHQRIDETNRIAEANRDGVKNWYDTKKKAILLLVAVSAAGGAGGTGLAKLIVSIVAQ